MRPDPPRRRVLPARSRRRLRGQRAERAGDAPGRRRAAGDARRPTAANQTPAFAGQTRAPGVRTEVAMAHTVVASGLVHPWGLALLPDGRWLVTERPGRLRIVSRRQARSASRSPACPPSTRAGQGGLLDVVCRPALRAGPHDLLELRRAARRRQRDLGRARRPVGGRSLGRRMRRSSSAPCRPMTATSISARPWPSRRTASCSSPWASGPTRRCGPRPSSSTRHMGKIIRINADGSVPQDNPFVGQAGALPEIWSLGHRNVQGVAVQPGTGAVWTIEHGTRGGDELNRPQAGKNYGWPIIAYGIEYRGRADQRGDHGAGGAGAAGLLLGSGDRAGRPDLLFGRDVPGLAGQSADRRPGGKNADPPGAGR